MDDNSYTINSLKEAISVFLENARILPQRSVRRHLMYRGHSTNHYLLRPSIFRKMRLKYESMMFQELKRVSPLEFPSSNSDLENLIKMQHYGLPTRLLDFSLNPLVALFFACQISKDEQHKNDDGEIIAFYESIRPIDSIEVERCAKLITYTGTIESKFKERMKIKEPLTDGSSEDDSVSLNLPVMKKYFPKSYYFIPAIHNNERISRQNGVFMLFGLNINSERPFKKTAFSYDKDNLNPRYQGLKVHFTVPAEKKDEILFELDTIGINHAFLFPELEHQATYITNKFSFSSISSKNDNIVVVN